MNTATWVDEGAAFVYPADYLYTSGHGRWTPSASG